MLLKFSFLKKDEAPLIESLSVSDCDQPAPSGYRWMCRYIWNIRETVRKEPFFLIPVMRRMDTSPVTEGYRALSRDWKYYYSTQYVASAVEQDSTVYEPITLFWTRRQLAPFQLPLRTLFYAVFSPNSQRLCGFTAEKTLERTHFDSFYVVECATRKVRRLFSCVKEFSGQFGWYHDSAHIWCASEASGKQRRQIFKCNVFTGKSVLLHGEAREKPFRDWDMLDPSYRYSGEVNNQALAYAPNHQVRVRVEPICKWGDAQPGDAEVYIEWRNGRTERLIRRGGHDYMLIRPLDISEDGQWVLLLCQNLSKTIEGVEKVSSDLVAWNARTKRHYVYPQEALGFGCRFVRVKRTK